MDVILDPGGSELARRGLHAARAGAAGAAFRPNLCVKSSACGVWRARERGASLKWARGPAACRLYIVISDRHQEVNTEFLRRVRRVWRVRCGSGPGGSGQGPVAGGRVQGRRVLRYYIADSALYSVFTGFTATPTRHTHSSQVSILQRFSHYVHLSGRIRSPFDPRTATGTRAPRRAAHRTHARDRDRESATWSATGSARSDMDGGLMYTSDAGSHWHVRALPGTQRAARTTWLCMGVRLSTGLEHRAPGAPVPPGPAAVDAGHTLIPACWSHAHSCLPKPSGLPLIHRHESAHICSRPSSAFHPSSCSAYEGSAYTTDTSPGRRSVSW